MKLKEFIKLVDTTKFCPITLMDKWEGVDGGDIVSAGGKIDQGILDASGDMEVEPDMDPKDLKKCIFGNYYIAVKVEEEQKIIPDNVSTTDFVTED